jgi:hypothetical protein
MSTCVKLLQSLRYFGFHFTQVPHTYSVSQPLPSHVSLSRNRHRRITEIDVYTRRLDISLLLWCQHVPNWFNHWGILDSTLHRYPIHILSPNHCHHMCLCQGIGTEESMKSTFIHKGSKFHCFYDVNMCPTGSIIEVFWIPLYTGTPYICFLPTTAIACVFVKE